ncbi:MAG: hypothetical protein ACXVDZ_20440, partial [Bacteroidia bacterium]
GNDSLAADIRDQLADSGHTGARVWGHSATGHFLDTWPLRYFDASSKGQPGESFFDYVFKDQISTNTNDVVNEINNQNYEISDPLQLQFITDKTREKVYPYYYDAYKLAMNTEEYPQVTNGKTEMVNLAEAAPTAPDPVAAIIRTTFDTSYKSKIPTALKLANSIIPIVKPKLLKKQ